MDIAWLAKIKTDSDGNVHYEAWTQPHGERTVLTKPKILCIDITLKDLVLPCGTKRYVLDAATYQRLVDAVKQ